jgi:hypothetical protein
MTHFVLPHGYDCRTGNMLFSGGVQKPTAWPKGVKFSAIVSAISEVKLPARLECFLGR